MSEAVLAPNPGLERPLFDLFCVPWQVARATVRNLPTGRHAFSIVRPMGPGSTTVSTTYFIEFTTPDGPVAIQVSKSRWELTQVGDAIPLLYRKGRRSGRLEAQFFN